MQHEPSAPVVLHEPPLGRHCGSTQIWFALHLPEQQPLASMHESPTGPGVAALPSAAGHAARQFVPLHRLLQQSEVWAHAASVGAQAGVGFL